MKLFGASVWWLCVRTHTTWIASSNPARVPIKTPLARKATGSHLVKSTSLGETQSPVSAFCYDRNRICNAVQSLFASVQLRAFLASWPMLIR